MLQTYRKNNNLSNQIINFCTNFTLIQNFTLMKKYLVLISLFLLNIATSAAQEQTKLNYTLVKKIIESNDLGRPASLFVKGEVDFIKIRIAELGGQFKYSSGDIAAVILPIGKVNDLAADPRIVRMEDNYMKLQVMNDSMVVKNRIVAVHAGLPPLPQGYDGTGVVMGFLDSGIDFTHPDFQDALGNTRVKFIWDHNLTGGVTPQPYNYGREFTASDIDNGLAGAHVDNYYGHGTHVTGVGTGNGLAVNHFAGAAPNVDIISVCVNWGLPDDDWLNSVADGVEYIFDKADVLGKPCVINISAGTYYGSHDAKDLQALMIDNLISSSNGRSVVCAAGNAGNLAIHVQHSVAPPDTSFTWFYHYAPFGPAIYIEMWADILNMNQLKFTIAADKTSPYYEFRGMIPYTMISQHLGILKTDTLKNSAGQRLALVQSYGQLMGTRYSMIFNVIPDSTTGYYYRLMNTGTGLMDLWSFQMVASGLPTPLVFPDIDKYVTPDLIQTIVSSFTCSDKVISVGNYINKSEYRDCIDTLITSANVSGDIAYNSSRGPTRDGRIKPDIMASGTVTLAPLVIASPPSIDKIAKLGCMHMRDGGTSTASPVVAGIAAMFFQRFPNANWQDVKEAITLCAYTDSFVTGTIPNSTWGYGKVDGFETIKPCALVGIHESNTLYENYLFASPNPFNEQTIIQYNLSKFYVSKNTEAKIFDVLGNEVRKISLKEKSGKIVIKKEELTSGIYFISLISEKRTLKSVKLVIL